MTFPKENKITKGQWFCKEGENQDVILSTRARIVRNLADFSFPNFLTKSAELIFAKIAECTYTCCA